MPCTREDNNSPQELEAKQTALERLRKALGQGSVSAVVGKNGALAFKGWRTEDRRGVSDLCAYRALANTPEMRRAMVRAEALAGRKASPLAIATGIHSHDDGQTWHEGH